MPHPTRRRPPLLVQPRAHLLAAMSLAFCAVACRAPEPDEPRGTAPADELPPAMVLTGTAYDSAIAIALPPEAPEEFEGLHNVYHLSESVVAGSEPHGAAALRALADMGIKTVISVDGKAPDAAAAAAFGLRYVHVPIQYKGLSDGEIADLAKTFRELDGPFYVHCFHGKHRGPAGAAVGRMVLDGAPRQTVIAEMRQYCGTSAKYEGLYRDVATARIPTADETRALEFDFPTAKLPRGVVGVMVNVSRANDLIEELAKRDFAADPAHPDVDARNEAVTLRQAFEAALELDEVKNGPADFRGWFEDARDGARTLSEALQREDGLADARLGWAAVQQSCTACHLVYRN